MTQTRNHEWQAPVDSFPENQRFYGVIPPGRYKGFDKINRVSALVFNLDHDEDGLTVIDIEENVHTHYGKWITKQGLVITETAATDNIVFVANTSGQDRYDYVLGSHIYDETTVGGNAAIYTMAVGTPGAGLPSVPLDTDVILGTLFVPNGATDINDATYIPADKPTFINDKVLKVFTPGGIYHGGIPYSGTAKVEFTPKDGSIFGLVYSSGTRLIKEFNSIQEGAMVILQTDNYDYKIEVMAPATVGKIFAKGCLNNGSGEFLTLPAKTSHLFRQTSVIVTDDNCAQWEYLGQLRGVGEDLVLSNTSGDLVKIQPISTRTAAGSVTLGFKIPSGTNTFYFWNRQKKTNGDNYIVMQDLAKDEWEQLDLTQMQAMVDPLITVKSGSVVRFKVIGKTMFLQFYFKLDLGSYNQAYIKFNMPDNGTVTYLPKSIPSALAYEKPAIYTPNAIVGWCFVGLRSLHDGSGYGFEVRENLTPYGIGGVAPANFTAADDAQLKGELIIEVE